MQVMKYRTDQGVFQALVDDTGRKWLKVLVMDAGGIRIQKQPQSEARFMTPTDYPLAKARKRFRAAGKKFGITKSAKQLLRG